MLRGRVAELNMRRARAIDVRVPVRGDGDEAFADLGASFVTLPASNTDRQVGTKGIGGNDVERDTRGVSFLVWVAAHQGPGGEGRRGLVLHRAVLGSGNRLELQVLSEQIDLGVAAPLQQLFFGGVGLSHGAERLVPSDARWLARAVNGA